MPRRFERIFQAARYSYRHRQGPRLRQMPSRYAKAIATEFPGKLTSADELPDAAILYRKILAGRPDKSVVMISVGQLTNFSNLLKTGPDEHSPLDGTKLVEKKVKAWVCMGGKIPEGREANLVHEGPGAAYAINHWPTPVVFSGFEIGRRIMTGAKLRGLRRQIARASGIRTI